MVSIIESWKDSLALLIPRNFKSFALITFKSMINTYKAIFSYWWFLYLASIALKFIVLFIVPRLFITFNDFETPGELLKLIEKQQIIAIILGYLAYALNVILSFFICLAVRTSITPKNYSYYYDYLKKYWYCLPLILCVFPIKIVLFSWLIYCLVTIFLFFIFDLPLSLSNTIQALSSSIRFMFHNAPLFLLLGLLLDLFYYIINEKIIYYLFIAIAQREKYLSNLSLSFFLAAYTIELLELFIYSVSLIINLIVIVILYTIYQVRIKAEHSGI